MYLRSQGLAVPGGLDTSPATPSPPAPMVALIGNVAPPSFEMSTTMEHTSES